MSVMVNFRKLLRRKSKEKRRCAVTAPKAHRKSIFRLLLNKMDFGLRESLSDETDTEKIKRRLNERHTLLGEARENELDISPASAVVLQDVLGVDKGSSDEEGTSKKIGLGVARHKPSDVLGAVEYRLAITDLFVEKAQYHLEKRASNYKWLGYLLYGVAVILLLIGTGVAYNRMPPVEKGKETYAKTTGDVARYVMQPAHATSSPQFPLESREIPVSHDLVDILKRFIPAFTAYGFIVLSAVALMRGARACLDQRERLLSKRHSLRQGRLYLHLAGGAVSIQDLERAFNWNHEQPNAFTNMPIDAKAPWGTVLEEIVKVAPELVKAGVNAAEKKGKG